MSLGLPGFMNLKEPAMSVLRQFRRIAFLNQNGRCWYCGLPMWERNPDTFAREHGFTSGLAKALQCTAEHLIARQDGGADSPSNIVAACRYCNGRRHARKFPLESESFRQHVQKRLQQGKWHPHLPISAS